jgi:plastocyanin
LSLLVAAPPVHAASLTVELRDSRETTLDGAVVYAVPAAAGATPAAGIAVMDQRNRVFVPRILPIQVGTRVRFPNSDNVLHQVYSFSKAKRFQLPLYQGTPAVPVLFDKPGVVALGCNIHDRMSAFIVVVDTPYFALAERGRAELARLPAGRYTVRVWYEGMKDEPRPEPVDLAADDTRELTLRIAR